MKLPTWDLPEKIVEESIKVHLKILTGYKGNPKTDQQKFREALTPRHVAISLTGEPTLYGYIGEQIQAFHRRGFTTFLVTNGTNPSILAKLRQEPTQLYISVCASDEATFKRVCRPQAPKAWEKLHETLSLLQSFKCPTAIRITAAKNVNMNNIEGYTELVRKAGPAYIEPKAYMYVGFSRACLAFENMPAHRDIREFAEQLADETGYEIVDESKESRVVLLSRLERHIRSDNR